jgi:integrase
MRQLAAARYTAWTPSPSSSSRSGTNYAPCTTAIERKSSTSIGSDDSSFHHGKRHPGQLSAPDIEAFLTHLAVAGNVSASTQNQALSAILFRYRHVLEIELPWLENVVRARVPVRVPVVLPPREVQALLAQLDGEFHLVAQLLYGSGLRLMEALRLRAKDLDFEYSQIAVRDGEGRKDRVTLLPAAARSPLQLHLAVVRERHMRALARGHGGVSLPEALARKYPNAAKDWAWQYVFPASRPARDPRRVRSTEGWTRPRSAP